MKGGLSINKMEIKVYGAEWCPFCVKEKKFLEEKKVKFTYIDVSDDEETAKYIMNKTKQTGIPVTEIIENGKSEFIIGFDEGVIRKKLKIK